LWGSGFLLTINTVRNVWKTEAGNLLIHQSSSNRVGLVKTD